MLDSKVLPIDAFSRETFASVYIEIMNARNFRIGFGTGFIAKFGGDFYLITARHVLLGASGNEIIELENSKSEFINTNCHIIGRNGSNFYLENRSILLDLYDRSRNRNWRQMFDWDIAVVDITDKVSGEGLVPVAIDLSEVAIQADADGKPISVCADDDLPVVGSDVFIVGYPGNLEYITGNRAPIWKRASIASEPHLALDNRPIFLIDTQGASGLSGSPVLFNGPTLVSPSGQRRACDYEKQKFRLVGIYCGREGYAPDAISLSMGRVFKLSAIQNTIMEARDA
ncbi:S1 family peptidase [Methylorubrum podarium]|jgi:Trypsin-like peptidase domain|uniref:S1 family peptidase n=1 Tax=Methylorubrum podarium TaxID=200476 RepID=UPI001EE1D875|nr:serine protease [Methylorubrum podarium]GJE68794.1 hypothetical protein CHKEEEPN_0313 [Methylorubrum podarium]